MDVNKPSSLTNFIAANTDYLADEPDVADLLTNQPEKASFIVAEAERDADCVRALLHRLAGRTPEGSVVREFNVPTELWHDMLWNLAAAVRLYRWERAGLSIHLRAGLPPGLTAILKALASYRRPDAFPEAWRERVSSLSNSRLVWAARELLDAVVIMDEAGEDELVEALARFAWEHRNDPIPAEPEEAMTCPTDRSAAADSSTTATAAARPSRRRQPTSNGPGETPGNGASSSPARRRRSKK